MEGDSKVVLVIKNLPANARDGRDAGLIPGVGGSSGVGNGNPLQCCCQGNPMNRGDRKATVHGAAKSWTQLRTQYCYGDLILGKNMQTKL